MGKGIIGHLGTIGSIAEDPGIKVGLKAQLLALSEGHMFVRKVRNTGDDSLICSLNIM